MKNITIDGRTFQYKVVWNISEYGSAAETDFFEGVERVKVFQFCFWRPAKYKEIPKLVFTVFADIESAEYSKEHVRYMIQKKIDELYNRPQELLRGEIV